MVRSAELGPLFGGSWGRSRRWPVALRRSGPGAWGPSGLASGLGAICGRASGDPGRQVVTVTAAAIRSGVELVTISGRGATVRASTLPGAVLPAWELGPLAILASCPAWAAPGVVFLPGVRAGGRSGSAPAIRAAWAICGRRSGPGPVLGRFGRLASAELEPGAGPADHGGSAPGAGPVVPGRSGQRSWAAAGGRRQGRGRLRGRIFRGGGAHFTPP